MDTEDFQVSQTFFRITAHFRWLNEATDLVYSHIENPLLKYLRFTGQYGRFSECGIRERLTLYLECRMTADAFLSPYVQSHPRLIRDSRSESRSFGSIRSQIDLSNGCRTSFGRGKVEDVYSLDKSRYANSQNQKAPKKVFQTWKIRIRYNSASNDSRSDLKTKSRKFSTNSFIHHGLQFELMRADVTLLCTVYRAPVVQISPVTLLPNWWFGWTRSLPENLSMPTSTIETRLGSSENFMEIRLWLVKIRFLAGSSVKETRKIFSKQILLLGWNEMTVIGTIVLQHLTG